MNLIGQVTNMRKKLLKSRAKLLEDTVQLRERFQSFLEPIEDLLALRGDTSNPFRHGRGDLSDDGGGCNPEGAHGFPHRLNEGADQVADGLAGEVVDDLDHGGQDIEALRNDLTCVTQRPESLDDASDLNFVGTEGTANLGVEPRRDRCFELRGGLRPLVPDAFPGEGSGLHLLGVARELLEHVRQRVDVGDDPVDGPRHRRLDRIHRHVNQVSGDSNGAKRRVESGLRNIEVPNITDNTRVFERIRLVG